MELFICCYCGLEKPNHNSLKNHSIRCKDNPDRKVQTGGGSKVAWNKGLTKNLSPLVAHSEETKRKISEGNKTRKWTGHTKEFCERQRQNALNKGLGGVTQSRWIKYKGKTLGSSYELEVAKSLDENGVKWDTCSRIPYIDPFGKKRTYTPDIYLIDYDVYLDPKNDFLIESVNPRLGFSDLEKIQLVREQANIRIIVLNKTQLDWNTIKTLL